MKYFLFFLMLFPITCHAGLDEVVLSDKSKKCAIRYLTKKQMNNFYIKTKKDCSDGWVQGYNSVELYDGKNQQTEVLNGFFMDGYWLGFLPAKAHVLNRTTPSENVQALTFIMDEDDEEDITYVVQLRSVQSDSGLYTAFQGCPIFRLLVVAQKKELFDNEAFQEKISQSALSYAKKLCAKLETIAVFGATKTDAQASDIVFQMHIDADTKEKTIVSSSDDFTDSAITRPIELRQQKSEILLSVIPESDGLNVQYGVPLPTPKKEKNKKELSLPITSLSHLDVQSRITEKAVLGKAVVHIDKINLDGTAQTDLPQTITLKYHPKLKIGWAIVQGMFYQNQMQVSDIIVCKKEWCSDVS